MATNPLALPQSEDLQRALFGHAVSSEATAIRLEATMGVVVDGKEFGWISPYYTMLWSALQKLRATLQRHPTATELRNAPEVLNEEPKMRQRLGDELQKALEARADVGLDVLNAQLIKWQQAVLIDRKVTELARQYNAGDIDTAKETLLGAARALELLESDSSAFVSSDIRAAQERAERLGRAGSIMSYGVTFLDQALSGIAPNDLVIIGAKTGIGKTQLMTRIATVNALKGRKVAFIALEAAKHEIERRMKFVTLLDEAAKDGVIVDDFDFVDWDRGRLEHALAKYEARVNGMFARHLSTLRTYYRDGQPFGVAELEREIGRMARDGAELIILDHLHYVDTSGKDDNADMKKIVKKLSDLAQFHAIPIVVVAHLRKTAGGNNHPLCPGADEIHGSSDIAKIATVIVTMASVEAIETEVGSPVPGYPDGAPNAETYVPALPTFFRIAKCRVEGNRTRYTAVAFFNPSMGGYEDEYALGQLRSGDTRWEPIMKRPKWAKGATIRLREAE